MVVFSYSSRPRSRPHHCVLDAGGDLSSDSSESHTDVARRDEPRRAPGLVDSSGCLHLGSRRYVYCRGGPLARSSGSQLSACSVKKPINHEHKTGTSKDYTQSFIFYCLIPATFLSSCFVVLLFLWESAAYPAALFPPQPMAVFGAQPNYLRHQRKPRDLFAFACSAVCSSSAFRRLGRLSPISSAFFTSNALLEPRPLRSTGITRFLRYYEPLRHP